MVVMIFWDFITFWLLCANGSSVRIFRSTDVAFPRGNFVFKLDNRAIFYQYLRFSFSQIDAHFPTILIFLTETRLRIFTCTCHFFPHFYFPVLRFGGRGREKKKTNKQTTTKQNKKLKTYIYGPPNPPLKLPSTSVLNYIYTWQ